MLITPATKRNLYDKTSFFKSRDRVKMDTILEVTGASVFTGARTQTGAMTCASTIIRQGANGQKATLTHATLSQNIVGSSGEGTGTITLTNLIPAGSLVLGITGRVTTILAGGLATFSVGLTTGSDTDNFATGIAVAAGTTFNSLVNSDSDSLFPQIFTAANSVTLTANTSNISTGVLRIDVHYISLTPETS